MFNRSSISRNLSVLAMSVLGLTFCTGSGMGSGSNSGSGCSPSDMQLIDDILSNPSPVTPTGTGGSTTPPVSTPPAAAAPLTVNVGASTLTAGMNETVTFTATVAGGTPPYTVFWMLADESGWDPAGNTFVRTISLSGAQTKTAYCQVGDAAGNYSDLASITISAKPGAPTGCNDIGGTYTSTYGTVVIDANGNGTNVAWGYTDTLTATSLTPGDGACADCMVLTGTWATTSGPAGFDPATANSGSIRWVFEPGFKSFSGKFSYDPNTHWQADFWSGSRSDCN